MTHGENGKTCAAICVDKLELLSGEASPPGAEKPKGFFSESGAPVPGVRDEKPGGLFIATTLGKRPRNGPEAAAGQPNSRQPAEPAEELPGGLVPAPWSLGGRPRVLTDEMRTEVCKLLAVGMSRRQAAAYLDIDASTISHAARRDGDFARNLQRAEEMGTSKPLLAVMAAGRRNWRAAAWLLKHRKEFPEPKTQEQLDEQHQGDLANARRFSEYLRVDSQLRDEQRDEEEARQRAKTGQEHDAPPKPSRRRTKYKMSGGVITKVTEG